MTEPQAVVDETKVPAPQGTEVEKRTDDTADLDVLLAEFDQKTKKSEPESSPPAPQTQPTIDPATLERIKRVESRLLEDDINEAVKQVFGERKVSPRVARGWLDQVARENPAVAQAFLNKANDPRTWNKFARSLEKEVEKDFPPAVDENATVDHEAVAQSVRGASTKTTAEPPPKLGSMSNAQYRKFCIDNYGYDPGV